MTIYKFKVCFRNEEDVSQTELKTYIIAGYMKDLNDAWKEVLQMATSWAKDHNQFISSIYYSLC
jgi:hypothetical protein